MIGDPRSGINVLDRSATPAIGPRPEAVSSVELRRIPLRHRASVAPPPTVGVWAKTFRVRRLILDVIALALIVGLAWLMWPTNLGGSTAYVIIKGTSMEPRFHTGDLAIVRAQDHYGVGDIVAYRIPKGNPGADQLVIHRIIGRRHGGFLLQGTNRTTPDAFYPKPSDILGRYRVLIGLPGIGFWSLLPWICCALVGVGAGWIAWPRGAERDDTPDDPDGGPGDGAERNADAILLPATPVIVGQRRIRRMEAEAEAQRAKHHSKHHSKHRGGGRRRTRSRSVPVSVGMVGIAALALAIVA